MKYIKEDFLRLTKEFEDQYIDYDMDIGLHNRVVSVSFNTGSKIIIGTDRSYLLMNNHKDIDSLELKPILLSNVKFFSRSNHEAFLLFTIRKNNKNIMDNYYELFSVYQEIEAKRKRYTFSAL